LKKARSFSPTYLQDQDRSAGAISCGAQCKPADLLPLLSLLPPALHV
jgi:hypothetical protein